MSRDTLPTDEQVLAAATKQAIQAAGGLDVCSRETGLSDTQLSRCSSPNHRDSITIRDANTIEALTHGRPGAPHILRARARLLNFVLVPRPEGPADADGLMLSVMDLTAELGDVANAVTDALRDRKVEPREAIAALNHLEDLDRASAALRIKLEALAQAAPAPRET